MLGATAFKASFLYRGGSFRAAKTPSSSEASGDEIIRVPKAITRHQVPAPQAKSVAARPTLPASGYHLPVLLLGFTPDFVL